MAGIKLEGMTELITGLKKRTDLSDVKKVVRMNGTEMNKKAQRNAPVDTGTLKRSIKLEIKDGGLTAESEPHTEYASYVEYGTRFMNAKPYMKPAFEEQKEQFKKDMKKLVK